MANQYQDINNMLKALKELYSDGSYCPNNARDKADEDFKYASENEYFYKTKLEAVFCEGIRPLRETVLKDLVYNKNPFLELVPKNPFRGYHIPVPLVTDEE